MVGKLSNTLLLVSFLALHSRANLPAVPTAAQRKLKLRHECGEIIDTITKEEIQDLLLSYAKYLDPISRATVEGILPKLKYGFQTRKICAACTEFSDLLAESSPFQEICAPEVYGNNAKMSGLLVMPMTDTSEETPCIPSGPLKGAVNTHGTTSQTFVVPSEWNLSGDPEEFFYKFLVLCSASFGVVTILPDYVGYGESDNFYKSYHIKKAYQTSTIPLWLEAKRLVAAETDCNSELVDIAAVSGFSEGGYSAVAVADGLTTLGVNVKGTYAGGGAYRISSAQITEMLRRFDAGLIEPQWYCLAAILGASYSSTNPDLANFKAGQDLVDAEWLSPTNSSRNVVHWLQDGLSPWVINALIPKDEPLSIMNQQLLPLVRTAVSQNDTYFCNRNDVMKQFDKLCEALIDNDLTETLESASYQVELCYSPDDEIIPPQNLPNVSANPEHLSIYQVSGDHATAGLLCRVRYVMYLAGGYSEENIEFSGTCTVGELRDDSGAGGFYADFKTAHMTLAISAMYLFLAYV